MPNYTTCVEYQFIPGESYCRSGEHYCNWRDSYCLMAIGQVPEEGCGYIEACPVCGEPLSDKKWHSMNRCADAQQL